MTDVANVQWPEDMVIDEVTFKEGWTQARDEFGMGFIKFNETGKIITADYSESCYNNKPKNIKLYGENIKSFTGVLDMVDFAIVAVEGQLVFGFGIALPTAVNILLSNYDITRSWESFHDHFASLEGDDVNHFKDALDKYVKGLAKPLDQKLTFDDLVDVNNPLYSGNDGKGTDKEYWIMLSEEIRLYYQTGESKEDVFGLYSRYDHGFIKHRKLPNI